MLVRNRYVWLLMNNFDGVNVQVFSSKKKAVAELYANVDLNGWDRSKVIFDEKDHVYYAGKDIWLQVIKEKIS